METLITVLRVLSWLRSYRTYEEWKQKEATALKAEILSSYRTYEEWKQKFR